MELPDNPTYRHMDNPSLATLLMNLNALKLPGQCKDGMYYCWDEGGVARLQRDLADLFQAGF